jgi:hypothetical protein
MESKHSLGAEEFIDALLDELSRWSGHVRGEGQQDDITVLAIDFENQPTAVKPLRNAEACN